ncbi:MAG: hypothetical protein ACJA1B_000720 [Polaribacter sp.]|jgi:hypothetical protein
MQYILIFRKEKAKEIDSLAHPIFKIVCIILNANRTLKQSSC